MTAQAGDGKAAPLAVITLSALGVVFGDIGTSPLYALRQSFHPDHGVALTPSNVYGILSLVFYALVLVISVKYLAFVLRADNRGEGGVLALMALVHPEGRGKGRRAGLVLLGLFGAALLYGDGMITPAISVLSAVEGVAVAAPSLSGFIIPGTIAILIGIFLVQHRGTSQVGAVFGPVTLVWFLVIGLLGLRSILVHPEVLQAVDPRFAVAFFAANGLQGFLVLGAVVLVVTGGEALYADMGHFGRTPIRWAWFAVALPALLLNYFGQGALLIADPSAITNPFYLLAPSWALVPLVVLATMATIIASQALISGAFSITMQAIHLGYVPRLRIEHTSASARGQIYVPAVNWLLAAAAIGLVLEFRTSAALAYAYGIAVTMVMAIVSILFYFVAREVWGWRRLTAGALVAGFVVIDAAFLAANVPKIPHGGWFPLVVAVAGLVLMTTWRRGRSVLAERLRETHTPLEEFIGKVRTDGTTRVSGTAVFLTGNPEATPPALIRMVKHTKVLHKQVLLLTVILEDVARVAPAERLSRRELGAGFHSAVAHYGFMEEPDVPELMEELRAGGFDHDPKDTTYFLGRERLVTEHGVRGMALWRAKLFAFMAQNAQPVPTYFRIPPERVVEVGAQIRP